MPNSAEMYKAKQLNIPLSELAWIYPEPRKRLFMDMIQEYNKRYPALKLLYAALNYNSKLKCDYLIIFETMINQNKAIIFDIPYLYTTRAVPGYRYAKREGLLDLWFNEAIMNMCRGQYGLFFEYIQQHGLGVYKGEPNNWKDPKFFDQLAECLEDQFILYKSNKS